MKNPLVKYQIENVVYVDFQRRGILTKGDLYNLEKRVDAINEALDLCGDNDQDIFDNLQRELDYIVNILEVSLGNTKKRKKRK